MRNRHKISVFCLTAVLALSGISRADYIDLVKQGNAAFTNQDYPKAMELYHKAETELPESPELAYNLGNGLYGQGQYEGAVEQYTKALNSTDIRVAQKAHFNLGNTYFRTNDYQKAITEFQEALKLDPNDLDAKFNLELARKMLKEQIKPQNGDNKDKKQQQQQQQQNQQDKDKQDQQKQDKEKQDQQNKQDSTQNQQNQDQQDQADSNQDKQQQQMKQAQQGQKMSKEDAERILNALKDDEQKIQQSLKRARGEAIYTGKDW